MKKLFAITAILFCSLLLQPDVYANKGPSPSPSTCPAVGTDGTLSSATASGSSTECSKECEMVETGKSGNITKYTCSQKKGEKCPSGKACGLKCNMDTLKVTCECK